MKPVIIAVAITGSVPRKKDNPAVPVTPPSKSNLHIRHSKQELPLFTSTCATRTKAPLPILRFSLKSSKECASIVLG
jgi:hypothetical protein